MPTQKSYLSRIKVGIDECSIETKYWLQGFLAGNEPDAPRDAEENYLNGTIPNIKHGSLQLNALQKPENGKTGLKAVVITGDYRSIKSMSHLILQDIQQLSVAERIQLVEDIWDSIARAPESLALTANQQHELDNRLAAHQQDSSAGASWTEIKVRIQS